MLTKFSNLEDFFNFLELKRAEIQADYEVEMTTKELEEPMSEGLDEFIEEFEQDIKNNNKCEAEENANLIQMAWSTSLDTPKPTKNCTETTTDTTLIIDQLNLNEQNYEIDDDFDCCFDELIDDYAEIANIADDSAMDQFDLLSFPMSQFPADFDIQEDLMDAEDIEIDEKESIKSIKSVTLIEEEEDKFDFDISMSQFPTTQKESEEFIAAFKTGRGNLIPPPSKEAMKRAHNLIELEPDEGEGESKDLPVFKTAKGKVIPPPSEDAIKRARNLANEIELEESKENRNEMNINNNINYPSFSTANGKVIPPPSKEAMEKARGFMEQDEEKKDDEKVTSAPITVGFSTGRGKALPPPSKEALERARVLIDINEPEPTKNEPIGFSTGKGKALPPPSKEALERARVLIDEPEPVMSESFGFSTGRGKALPPPSEEAIKKTKSLLSNNYTDQMISKTIKTTRPMPASSSKFAPIKPFSLSTAWKRPRKPANIQPKPIKPQPEIPKLPSLFNLDTAGMQRFKMKEFFKSPPNLSLTFEDYKLNYEIDPEILLLDSRTAPEYKFSNGWGVQAAHRSLLENGAQSVSASLEWTKNHYRWIIWKFAAFIRTFPDSYSPANLSPNWVLSQLLYRYEREVHLCQRSALKKIVERDDAAGKYLCLIVAGVDYANKAIELSDGWYSIWTGTLDSSLWELVISKRIHVGLKIEITGASLTGQDAIPALEASSPDCPCRIVISRNSCRPAKWDTKLGFICTPNRAVSFMKHLHQIHFQGGPIPAISVVIDRMYPLIFREERTSGNTNQIVSRNERDHFIYLETLTPETIQSSKFTPIQRIRIVNNSGNSVFPVTVTFWNPIGEDQRALLQEGNAVIITNLRTTMKAGTLASSKSTRLFKDTLKTATAFIPSNNKKNNVKELKMNDSVDFDGVIALGRVGNYFWFCQGNRDLSDSNETEILMCLRNFTCTSLHEGDLINFRDLAFNLFDGKVGVANFSFTEYSDFKRVGKVEDSGVYEFSLKRFKSLIE